MGSEPNSDVKNLTLVPGRFYLSSTGQTWCCYNTDKDAASCVCVQDNCSSRFSIDGRDLETGEKILIASIGEDYQTTVEHLNRQIVSDSIRIKYFRRVLETISKDSNPDRMALLAFDTLTMLSDEKSGI